ncbi:hypothetical protein A2U01_0024325 [Trifolium medium]|uniref:Uncharacterized protein n=1 Tax=Trifolium medium TaxID=97028 RepID=A0A392NVT9_9FABA|nr:hypothetical protein [Trifolium medium]
MPPIEGVRIPQQWRQATTTVEGTEFGVATECCVAAIMGESASGNGAVLSSNNDGWCCWAMTIVSETTTVMGVRWQ